MSILQYAEKKNHKRIVKIIRKAIAKRAAATVVSSLLDDAKSGDLEAVKKAVNSGADLEQSSKDGYTALIYAAAKGHKEVVEYLLKVGADPRAKDIDGMTALMYAEKKGHAQIAKMLSQAINKEEL